VHANRARCSRCVPARRSRASGRSPWRHARRGHRLDACDRAYGPAGRVRRARESVDRGSFDRDRAVASTLSVVVRDDAGRVQAPPRVVLARCPTCCCSRSRCRPPLR
jgi:hypothetical protein